MERTFTLLQRKVKVPTSQQCLMSESGNRASKKRFSAKFAGLRICFALCSGSSVKKYLALSGERFMFSVFNTEGIPPTKHALVRQAWRDVGLGVRWRGSGFAGYRGRHKKA